MPALSVVVVSFTRTRQLLYDCLGALARQRVPGGLEIIVVRSADNHDPDDFASVRSCFPDAIWLNANGGTVPHMRRLGVAGSKGTIVALIEDDCMVDAEWSAAVLLAHVSPYAAVGGAVEPGNYGSSLDWAAYFCDYARFMLPFRRCATWVLPGNNVSYKREVVPELLAVTVRDGLQEVFLHTILHERGKLMVADPRVIIRNEHAWTFAAVSTVPFHHARAFAGQRARPWSAARKVVFTSGAVLLPFLHVARVARRVITRRRAVLRFIGALPWVALFGISWAVGECIGYATGPGDSAQHWQ